MSQRIIHVLDSTTSADGVEILAQLIADGGAAAHGGGVTHHLTCLGHRSTGNLAALAGIDPAGITWVRSMGWADPAGWRGVRRIIAGSSPTHVHVWGSCAAAAVARSGFAGPRIATFADLPGERLLRLLRNLDRGLFPHSTAGGPVTWIATSQTLCSRLAAAGLAGERLRVIRPGVAPLAPVPDVPALRKRLGILPQDGPVLLLGAEGTHARADDAIWAAAIVHQLFPRTRLILRPDARSGETPGLGRFFDALPDDRMLVFAPDKIAWHGLVPAADILLVAANATIPVASVLHAMAAGVPIVATPIDCLTEMLDDARSAFFAPAPSHAGPAGSGAFRQEANVKPRALAARLEQVLSNPALAASVAAAARETISSRYDPASMLRSYRTLYCESARN